MNHILQAQSKDSLCLSSGVLVTQRRRPSVSCSFAPSGRATRRPSPTLTTAPSASRAIRPTTWSASCPAGNHSLRNTSRKCGSKDWRMGIVLCLSAEFEWRPSGYYLLYSANYSFFLFGGGSLANLVFSWCFWVSWCSWGHCNLQELSCHRTNSHRDWKRPQRVSWRLHAVAVAGYELSVSLCREMTQSGHDC